MTNKVYEIKRADMLNIKEYSVWKHANEEVWEVDDGKIFFGSDPLVIVERKQVIEFDWKGSHYRVYRKAGDTFGKNECLNYITYEKTVCVAYHRFSEDDFVHITFKDSETDVAPAATLPKGWNWVENLDESGYLEDPEGKAHFVYEVQYINAPRTAHAYTRIVHHGFCNRSPYVFGVDDEKTYGAGIEGFKKYAEKQVCVKAQEPMTIKWLNSVVIAVEDKEYELLCEFTNGCYVFQEKGAMNVLILQNGKMIQGLFSLEADCVKDLLTYIDSMPDLYIVTFSEDFEKLCIDALKRDEIYPHLYQDEMLSEVQKGMTHSQIIAMGLQKFVSSKVSLICMKSVDEYTIPVKELKEEAPLEKIRIPEKPENKETITPAATLPKGWSWVEYSDWSGFLKSPSGEEYFQYDWTTGDYKERYEDDWNCYLDENYESGGYTVGSFEEFKSYAETRVYVKVIKPLSESLIKAVENNDTDKVLELIEAGADVNCRDVRALTVLDLAVPGNLPIIKLLVEAGADVNAYDVTGQTNLLRASYCGKVEVVKYLLEHGADPSLKSKTESGITPSKCVKELLSTFAVPDTDREVYEEILKLLEGVSDEPTKYKFGNAVLPCNGLKDFETEDTSVSIPCRIYLTQAPIEQYERAMKEVDGEFYSPYNFFIEGVAMKNKPDDELVIKKWMLLYALENGHVHKFGYVNDVPDSAWEYFKEYIGIDKKEFELCVTWEMCGKVKVKANSLEEAMDIFNNTSDHIKLPEGNYVDGSFQLSTADLDEMAEMTNQISE